MTYPFRLIASDIGLPKHVVQLAFRLVLGGAAVASLARLRAAIATALGPTVATSFMLLTVTQFHLPFYMSRPLPNTLALVITTAGLAEWVRGRSRRALALLAFAAAVFRCDVLMLGGLVSLHLLLTRQVSLVGGLAVGGTAALAGLALSVGVDSAFWGRWLWPEGEVLWFNTALNK